MKKFVFRILMSLMWLAGATSAASAADRFYVNAANVEPGETRTLAFKLDNGQPYYGFQADIALPQGLTFVTTADGKADAALSGRCDGSYTLVSHLLDAGSLRLGAFSLTHSPIAGSEGELLYLTVKAAESFAGGTLGVTGILFVDATDRDVPLADASVSIGTVHRNVCYIPDFTVTVGQSTTVEVMLENETSFSAFQTDLCLPEGLEMVEGSLRLTSRAASSHEVTAQRRGDGSIRIVGISLSLDPLAGAEGALLEFDVTAATTLAETSVVSLKHQIFSTAGAREYVLSDESAQVKAIWPIYALTYLVDGEVYRVDSVAYGAAITPAEAPEKEGYTFSGWSEVPATMPAHDVTVEGTFTVNSYTLTYLVDGEVYADTVLTYGAEIVPIAAPEREGYTFSGWSEVPATMPAHDVTVEGTFTVNMYVLTYVVDGEVYKTYSLAYGDTIAAELAPEREGYTFSGWGEVPATMPAHDVTVTGTFTVNTYVLTYLVDGEVYKTYSLAYGDTITAEPAPEKEGHIFSGWGEIPATMPARDVTVEGVFTVNSGYLLTYVVDGEVYKVYSLAYGDTITAEPAPEREGYTFSGWSEMPATMPAHDVTVEGTFTVNTYVLTYVVDGEVYLTETLVYGAAITPAEAPEREGYTFSGWSEVPATMPAHDVTVEGTFTVNTYVLTYVVDGEVYATYTLAYGAAIITAEAPEREGYTFSGWSEMPATMPAHDVTITGTFTVNYYVLTWMVDGEVYHVDTLAYGSEIVEPADPTLEGYDFGGWIDVPATMPAHDLTIYSNITTGIESVASGDLKGCAIYTLSGQKVGTTDVTALPAGTYIVGGKKVMKR